MAIASVIKCKPCWKTFGMKSNADIDDSFMYTNNPEVAQHSSKSAIPSTFAYLAEDTDGLHADVISTPPPAHTQEKLL